MQLLPEVEHMILDWVQKKWLGTNDQEVNHKVPIKCRSPPIKCFQSLWQRNDFLLQDTDSNITAI